MIIMLRIVIAATYPCLIMVSDIVIIVLDLKHSDST